MRTRQRACHERNNPPIPDSMMDRVWCALRYYHEREEGLLQWDIADVWKKAGISRRSFYKYKKEHDLGNPFEVILRGRPAILNDRGFEILERKVTERGLTLDAPKSGPEFAKLMQESAEEAKDDDEEVTLCDQTIRNYKKRFLSFDNADVKSSGRVKAFLNIRNPLSLCAMLKMFQKRGLNKKLICSTDDTSILLGNIYDKPTVILTEEARRILAELNIAPSTTQPTEKRRLITVNCTIAGTGECICRVIKFADKNFSALCKRKDKSTGEERLRPFVCKLIGLDKKPLYIILYLYGMDDTTIETAMYQRCIFPSVIDHKKRYLECPTKMLEILHGSQSTGSGNELSPPYSAEGASDENSEDPLLVEIAQALHDGIDATDSTDSTVDEAVGTDTDEEGMDRDCEDWGLLLQDGAHGQIRALTMNLAAHAKKEKIYLGKYAGGCSMTQSANDVGNMHKVLKTLFHSNHFRYSEPEEIEESDWIEFKKLLQKHMDSPASFKSVWKFFQSIDGYLQRSFCKATIASAFNAAGIVPFNSRRILSKNKHYRELTRDKADAVKSKIDDLSDVFGKFEMIPEGEFDRVLGDLDNHVPTDGKPLNAMAVNRQRAVVLGNTMESTLDETRSVKMKRKCAEGGGEKIRKRYRTSNIAAADVVWPICKKMMF